MSKVTKRKITVENPGNKLSNSNTISNIVSNKDSQRRQSVFERLGTKTGASISINTGIGGPQQSSGESFCRHWSQNGTCPYGKSCVFVNTHILISPSKRVAKKDIDPKQILARSLEEGLKLEGLKRLHSTVVKRGSPDLNWESWDQTDLEYEDEKVLEKRRQLLQRELELQMKREETEEHHSKRRHPNTKQKKGLSSSSSTSVSSTTSESSTSSDDSSSDSTSTSGVAGDSKRRRNKTKKTKRGSTSSVSDSDRKKVRSSSKSMHKDRSPSNMSRKSASSRDKRAFTPPKKSAPNAKMVARKKSLSPHRRHNTPTTSSKSKPSTSKSSSGSRHIQSPRPSKRSTSVDRKDKHKRSPSPRPRGKTSGTKERSPRRQDPRLPRRKDSPDSRPRNTSRSRQTDSRNDDRKKDDDRSRNKDDRRPDRKPASDRDKRDHDDARARDKAREAAREKEREEALERCRERQREREREQQAKEKERNRDRLRDDRDKDNNKQRDYDKSIPPIMTVSVHNQGDRKLADRDRDRSNKDRKDREKDRDKDKDRDRERLYDRNVDKSDRNRPLEKDRLIEKLPERDRGNEKDRPRERENLNDRSRERIDRDRSFERDRNFERSAGEPADRTFDRDKDRASKALDRNRDRDFERDKDRNYDRIPDNRRSFEKAGDRDKTSLEKDRGVVRDRALDRVLELRERNKSLERGRASDGERSVDRNRERYDREGRFDRRALTGDDKGYESPYDTRRDRPRYGTEGAERVGMFKELSPPREDSRSLRHSQGFNDDRRSRVGRDVRGGWEQRCYDDAGSTKARDWDYPDSRREWDTRNRHGDWESAVEGEEWGRYSGGEWGGDWRDDWQHRPPRHPQREDQTIVSSNHIIVRDANNDEPGGRRSQIHDSVDKDPVISGDFKKDGVDSGAPVDSGSLKRPREDSELAIDAKKPRLEEPLPSVMLEEALSDISDDPDEILNREDIDVTPQDSAMEEDAPRTLSVTAPPSTQELDQRLLEERPNEDENIDNLDFEEISDEELEEEARANKGLGDALGVDWASLVAESRPRPAEAEPGAARRRWQPDNILARIGVSLQYAGEQLYNQIQQKLAEKKGEKGDEEKLGLLHPVASLHLALRDRQARRRCLFSGVDTFKRALSARTDIAIRRQLCNLPVATLETQQSSGFCQWVV